MPSFAPDGNVLYLVVCAAPPAQNITDLIKRKQNEGWEVCVTATPSALDWIDVEAIEALTGYPVRHRFRHPDEESEDVPLGNALLVSPATFNTINKWAAGINDNLAMGLLNESLGRHVPVEAQPYANDALASHPAYSEALAQLDAIGVAFSTIDW